MQGKAQCCFLNSGTETCPGVFETNLDCTATVVCHKNITVTREAPHEIQEGGSDMTFWGEALRALLISLKFFHVPLS